MNMYNSAPSYRYSLMGKSGKPASKHDGEVLLEVQLLTYSQAEQVNHLWKVRYGQARTRLQSLVNL